MSDNDATRPIGNSRGRVARKPCIEALEARTFLSVSAPTALLAASPVSQGTALTVDASTRKAVTGTPNITASLTGVPTSAVTASKTTAAVTVRLTNSGTGIAKGPVTVTFFTSADQVLDPSDAQVTAIKKSVSIRPGKSAVFKVPLRKYPSVANGTYWLLAQLSGTAAGTTSTAISPNAIRIAVPFVDLTGSFTSLPATVQNGKRSTLVLDIVNNGTTQANGRLQINFGRSAASDGASEESVTDTFKTIHLKPGAHMKVTLSGKADLTPGTFYMVANIDPSDAFHDASRGNNLVVSSAPVRFT